jgi:tetratricopeptide (TPR) repeat protein
MDFSMRKIFCLAVFAALTSGCGRKPSGEDAFARGIAYYKEDKFDKAVPYFEQALTSLQTNALALNFLGVCRLKEGESAAGLANLQDAVRLDPNYVPARYNLALAQLEQGQSEDAVANLRQVSQSSSAPANVHYQLGLAYMRVSAWGQAEEAFKRHLQSNPNSIDTLNCLGIVAARKHEFPLSKRYFEQCIAADPKFATAYLNLASLENHQLVQKKEALSHYETYLELLPKLQPREDVRLAMLQINQELAAEAKQPARPTESPAKPTKPPEPTAPPPVEAAQAPKPAAQPPITAAPKPVVTAPAPVVTATVVSVTPPPPSVPVKKVRTPVTAKVLKPGNRAKATAYYNEGVKYQQSQPATAIADYTKAVDADPTFAKAYYNLGIAYGNAGQPEHAMENYEMALLADSNYADARFNYAILLQQQGYTDDAVIQLERIVAENPNDAAAHLSVATIYAHDRSTFAKARDHYLAYLRLSPNSSAARDIRRWLDQNH